jgi:hypothetical protein
VADEDVLSLYGLSLVVSDDSVNTATMSLDPLVANRLGISGSITSHDREDEETNEAQHNRFHVLVFLWDYLGLNGCG